MLRSCNPRYFAAFGIFALGCNYFDAELEQLIRGPSDPVDAGNDRLVVDAASEPPELDGESDTGTDGPVTVISGADFCVPSGSVPVRVADDLFLDVSTTGLRNEFSD